jgi:hypothetical protein
MTNLAQVRIFLACNSRVIAWALLLTVSVLIIYLGWSFNEAWKTVTLGVATSIIASVLFDAITFGLPLIERRAQTRRAQLLFGQGIADGTCRLVVPSPYSNVDGSVKAVNLKELNGVLVLLAGLSRMFGTQYHFVDESDKAQCVFDRDWMTFGFWSNYFSRELAKDNIESLVEGTMSGGTAQLTYLHKSGNVVLGANTNAQTDNAIIVRIVPKEYPSRVWWIVFGGTQHGTASAALAIAKRWMEILELLLSVAPTKGSLHEPSIFSILLDGIRTNVSDSGKLIKPVFKSLT